VSPSYSAHVSLEAIERVRTRYALPSSYLLYVGRLEPRKNLPRLLDAYRRLVGRTPSLPPLILAGAPGWHWRETEPAIRRLGSAVKMLGYVAEDDLPALYAQARIFVYPSLYEGFGIPVLEALACGTPTITSNRSSTAEVAGGAAELVDPYDVADISAAIGRLLDNDLRRDELRRKGLARAAQFSWDRTATLTRDSYARTMGDRRAAP
jgi:glycosyltransferase involved in cell wall biosynthesis